MKRQTTNKKAWFITGLLLGALTLIVLIGAEMWRAAEDKIRQENTLLLELKAFFASLADKSVWKDCWKTIDADIIIVRFSASLVGMVIHWLLFAAIL